MPIVSSGSSHPLDVTIIGAGAAGLAAAIFARRMNPERTVALIDGAKKIGAKILVSGGGRCNVTNTVVTERDFWGGRSTIVRNVLRSFTVAETVAFFASIGITLHEETDGKLFPDSNRARDVLSALVAESERVGVRLYADTRVHAVMRVDDRFVLSTSQEAISARHVVLATGGQSLPKSGSDGAGYEIARALGHTIVPTTPALAPLMLDVSEPLHRSLTGVAHDAELTVWIDGRQSIRLTGPLLWTHFGVSGPVALNASRHWARAMLEPKDVRMTLNFSPPSTFDTMDERIMDLAAARPRASTATILSTFLPAAVAAAVIDALDFDPQGNASQLARTDRRRLVHALVERTLPITGTRGYNYAEATAGGVDLAEIDSLTMESRLCHKAYLIGEMLDVDGRIGGFNFQWAWSSAFAAARALSRRAV